MIRNRSIFAWIFLCVVVSFSALVAQVPNFIERLSGGTVQNKDFRAEIPFTYVDERISVKARISDSDKEYTFILDTYAPCMVRESLIQSIPLDTLDLTEQMGKQLEDSMMKPLFPKYRTIRLGDVVFKDIGAMAMREDEDNPFVQVLENGLIGANLLKCCIWQFDTGSKGFLTLSSASLLALVDSGDAVALHRRSISPIKNPDTDIETYHLAKLKSLKIGEKTFNDLPVGVYRLDDEKNATRGNIGIEFMKHFIVTIDWPENQLYLAPIEGREMKHNIQTFGLTYGHFDGEMRVESIYGGSEGR